MSKILTEGPGAGYNISGTISDVIVNSFKETGKYSDQYGNYTDFELDATANFEDVKADSYEYGGDIESVPVKITKVSLQKLDINGNEDDTIIIDSEFIKESIAGLKIKILYGAGWVHSKFDGIITASKDKSEISGNDYDWTNDCVDKITFNFVEQSDIDLLDNLVISDPYDFFDDEEMFESKSNDVSSKPSKVNRGLLEYLFNEVEFTGRGGAEPDIDRLSSYDDIIEYYDDTITKKEFKDTGEYLVKLVFDAKYYYNDDDREVYIQLSDNHTMWDINVDISEYKYSDMVDFAISKFESKTGVDLYLLGRSGRHVCVKLTLDNLEKYKELSEIQSKLEKELVNDINGAKIEDVSVDYKTADNLNETKEVKETMSKRYFKVVEKIGDGNYYNAYFINAEYPSDAEEIAKKHAERYGNEIFGIELTTKLEVENGKKRGMSVIEESYNILDSYSVYEIKDAITGKIIQKISTTDEDENDQNTWISDEEVIKDYANDNIIITKYNYDGNNILDDSVVIYPEEDYDLNESCTSNKCDYTDDGKDDIVRKYEIRMNGEFQEYVTGTEETVMDRIKDYESADEADRQLFVMNGIPMPTYTYSVVEEKTVTEGLKFDVDENFRIRESNHIVG